ncbi:hypothetical protein [Schlesneria paludicola]|uniref:hypothetical protein n=1 Tax=Schlesneria paludicola TaxID=360056 RepID=UPI00029B2FBB|nr:hypothetical protein [Schlesneria paludicola]
MPKSKASTEPPCILSVGYQDILLPSVEIASKVLSLLSKGVACRDRAYEGKIVLSSDALRLEMSVVRPKTRIVNEDDPLCLEHKAGT